MGEKLNECVSGSLPGDSEGKKKKKKKKSAETRAIKKQGISTNTDHVFSSSTQWFYKAWENS